MRSYEDLKAKCFVERLLQTSKSRGVGGGGGGGGGTAVPRKKCPAWGDNNY